VVVVHKYLKKDGIYVCAVIFEVKMMLDALFASLARFSGCNNHTPFLGKTRGVNSTVSL
jgi:hypothetical protein